jgi:D-alanine transaminase/branched-chain amino acid aminotransferase
MRLEANPDREQLKRSILLLMEKNNIPNSSIKIILTGGYSEDGYAIGNPNLIIFQTHFKMENNNLENGTKLITYNYQREVPEAKTIDYLQAIWLQPYIQDNNADDVLYHHDGIVSECPRANFFIVTDKAIITPQSNILKGITRMKVLNMNLDGYVILEKDLNLSDLKNAKEAFITSTTRNISPIVSINGDQVGDGKIGIVTKQLNEKLFNLKLSVK